MTADTADDAIAQQVEWGALKPTMGSNFRTHRIAKSGSVWVLKPTSGVKWMVGVAWFFAAFGWIAGLASVGKVPWWGTLIALAAGTFFFAVGFLVLSRIERPVFDLGRRRFRANSKADPLALGEVHALQIAPHMVDDHNESARYWSFELNLVHHDASRTRVLSHGNLEALRGDAAELATALGVPLWDGSARGDTPWDR